MKEITFTRFLYPDTNILSILVTDLTKWRPLQDFLYEHDLCIAVSAAQVAELSEVPSLHSDLNTLLTAVPSVIVKPLDVILKEEVKAHPKKRTDTLVMYHLNALFGKQDFAHFLSSDELAEARRGQHSYAAQMRDRLESLKSNFPPLENGKYSWKQAEEFAWLNTIQWLAILHPTFLARFKNKPSEIAVEVFLSVQIHAYMLFYKYYLHGKEVRESDFGDLFHLCAIPYCHLAILERDMSNVLNHIKSNHILLDNVTITNVDFFRDWEWNGD